MLVDSHCHLDRLKLSATGESLSAVLDAAQTAGVGHFLCVAVDTAGFDAMRTAVNGDRRVSFSAGVHPCDIPPEGVDLAVLQAQLAQPAVVAVGETGLDYFHGKTAEDRQRQRVAFEQQIAIARAGHWPLIIHCRDAWADCLAMLQNQGVTGVFHCFTGTVAQAREALDLGFYVSFSGVVTFKSAHENAAASAFVPADRFLVETDAPYLAPMPYRGQPNVPRYVREVAAFVAAQRGASLEQVATQTTANFRRLFALAVCP